MIYVYLFIYLSIFFVSVFVLFDFNKIFCFILIFQDPFNEPVSFKLEEDDHENGSIILVPKLEGKVKNLKQQQ